jgi:hypothetical protein
MNGYWGQGQMGMGNPMHYQHQMGMNPMGQMGTNPMGQMGMNQMGMNPMNPMNHQGMGQQPGWNNRGW